MLWTHEAQRSESTTKDKGQMTNALALPGFNYLGRSVTPIFLLMDHFLFQFSMFSEKRKKIYLSKFDSKFEYRFEV